MWRRSCSLGRVLGHIERELYNMSLRHTSKCNLAHRLSKTWLIIRMSISSHLSDTIHKTPLCTADCIQVAHALSCSQKEMRRTESPANGWLQRGAQPSAFKRASETAHFEAAGSPAVSTLDQVSFQLKQASRSTFLHPSRHTFAAAQFCIYYTICTNAIL